MKDADNKQPIKPEELRKLGTGKLSKLKSLRSKIKN